MWIFMARIAIHAAGNIGFCFFRTVTGHTALREGVHLFPVSHFAGAVLVKHGYCLHGNVGYEAVAPFEMLRGHQAASRGISP